MQPHRKSGRTGNSLVEVTLLAPWIFFLFVGVLDFGFYAYTFISTENAARAAALLTSRSKSAYMDPVGACQIVTRELQWAAYGRDLTDCNTPTLQVTTSPVLFAGSDAVEVKVQFQMLSMIPIPGVLAKDFLITQIVRMKIDPFSE